MNAFISSLTGDAKAKGSRWIEKPQLCHVEESLITLSHRCGTTLSFPKEMSLEFWNLEMTKTQRQTAPTPLLPDLLGMLSSPTTPTFSPSQKKLFLYELCSSSFD